ncbi:hypothetical protein [Pseudomonas sp. UBA4617]|uniref:hypothetical protein n=1 Tax=Pseudomonas sp. UBA4617 TaxID=1947318 RepID=UPI0025DBBC21|nr:hypothetical protein [Pseudomonas sp. UBA4617]
MTLAFYGYCPALASVAPRWRKVLAGCTKAGRSRLLGKRRGLTVQTSKTVQYRPLPRSREVAALAGMPCALSGQHHFSVDLCEAVR